MERKISKLLAEILDVYEEDITPELELMPEFGVEPIDVAKLVMACEKKFKTIIHDEQVHRFRTVADIAHYLENGFVESAGNTRESSDEERQAWYY